MRKRKSRDKNKKGRQGPDPKDLAQDEGMKVKVSPSNLPGWEASRLRTELRRVCRWTEAHHQVLRKGFLHVHFLSVISMN